MKDLKEKIALLISEYFDKKTSQIEIDDDTEYEIYKTRERYIKHIDNELDDLESEIDSLIESMNEPSQLEQDIMEYERTRYLGGV